MGRLEYRIFAPPLADLRARLAPLCRLGAPEHRTDVYLLGQDARVTFKLRGASALELKLQLGRAGGCARWHAVGTVPLPARGEALAAAFEGADDFPDIEGDTVFDADTLTAAFRAAGALPVTVAKQRRQGKTCDAMVEVTQIATLRFGRAESLCIEAAEPAPINVLRGALGLGAQPSVSYPAWLWQRLGPAD